MARGWESKAIEAQQEDLATGQRTKKDPPQTPAQRAAAERRRTLELARARVVGDLAVATSDRHRKMLEQALAAIDAQLRAAVS